MTEAQYETELKRLNQILADLHEESEETVSLVEKIAIKAEIKVVREVISQFKLGYYILVEK